MNGREEAIAHADFPVIYTDSFLSSSWFLTQQYTLGLMRAALGDLLPKK